MSDLLEIVFENIPTNLVASFLIHISESGRKIKDYSLQNEISKEIKVNWKSIDSVNSAINDMGDGSYFLNLTVLKIESLKIKECSIQILKYEDKYDVNIQIPIEKIDTNGLVQNIMKFSKNIAKKFGVKSYFGGLEPAMDEDTRIFTNESIGPLNLGE